MGDISTIVHVILAIFQTIAIIGAAIWVLSQIRATNTNLKDAITDLRSTMREVKDELKATYEKQISQEVRIRLLEEKNRGSNTISK